MLVYVVKCAGDLPEKVHCKLSDYVVEARIDDKEMTEAGL